MNKRTILISGRMFFGALTLVALGVQLSILLGLRGDPINFFSYFTNLSNVFAAVVFLIGAIYLMQGREPTPRDELIRGASVVAVAIVGIVYFALLRNEDLGPLQPWVNAVIHFVMPLAVVVDWLYQPPKATLRFQQVGYWLIYPLVFLVYTIIRGAIVNWYPYPFLNPAKVGGYGGVALYSLTIFVAFLAVGALLIWLGNTLRRTMARTVAPGNVAQG